jgi:hypothetical protein
MDKWGHHWQDIEFEFSPMAQIKQKCALCGTTRTIVYTFTPREINYRYRTYRIVEQGWEIKGNSNIPCTNTGSHCNVLTRQEWDADDRVWKAGEPWL